MIRGLVYEIKYRIKNYHTKKWYKEQLEILEYERRMEGVELEAEIRYLREKYEGE